MFTRLLGSVTAVALVGVFAASALAQTNPITSTGALTVELKTRADLVAGFNPGETGPPLWGTHAEDSRWFVVGQKGQIKIVDFTNPVSPQLVITPFLDAQAALTTQGFTFFAPSQTFHEYGLLGLAFHPDYKNSGMPGFGKFYTFTSENPGVAAGNAPTFSTPEVTGNGTHQSVVREWSVTDPVNSNVANTASSRVLLRIRKVQDNHNGGAIVFGNDGYLHISTGDGGGGFDFNGSISSTTDGHTNAPNPNPGLLPHGNGQDLTNVLGKILRINPVQPVLDGMGNPVPGNPANDPNAAPSGNQQYQIPNSNPFSGATAGVDEIFAYGLRNPFRISVDSATGKIYAADVGQTQREEIDVIVNGGNYGWVIKEGTIDTPTIPAYTEPPGLIAPIGEYTHGDGIAVIGGFVYRGSKFPALVGKYVFGEYDGPGATLGRLFYMDINDPGPNTIRQFQISSLGNTLPAGQLHGFGEGANGEIFALLRAGEVVELIGEPLLGDFNRDWKLTNTDIQAMLGALPNLSAYSVTYGLSNAELLRIGDFTGDNMVTTADIQPLLNKLVQGGLPAAVPEPGSAILMALGGLWLLSRRRRITC